MSVGVVLPQLPIAVDYWRGGRGVRARFLTHMHGDHYSGLSPTWNMGRIYCTSVSAALLVDKFHLDASLITTVDVGESLVLYLDDAETVMACVTALPANHCPGACMFLFEGDFGRILHTGDFRFHPALLEHPVLAPSRGTIDLMYLDTTYNQERCVLPSREDAFAEICAVVDAHPDHDVVLGIDNLGKEELLIRLAHRFKSLVVVSPERLRWLLVSDLTDVSVFTTEAGAGRFVVEPRRIVTRERILQLNQVQPTIGIVASGWATAGRAGAIAVSSAAQRSLLATVAQSANASNNDAAAAAKRRRKAARTNKDDDSIDDDDDPDDAPPLSTPYAVASASRLIYRVPYSLHSSFAELTQFVAAIRPKKIVAITATFTDISHFDRYLSPEPSNLRPLADLIAAANANAPPVARAPPTRRRVLNNDRTTYVVGNAVRRALGGIVTVNRQGERLAVRLKYKAPKAVEPPIVIADDTPPPSSKPAVVSIPSSLEDAVDEDAVLLSELIYVQPSLDLICSPSHASIKTVTVDDVDDECKDGDAKASPIDDGKMLAFLQRVAESRSPACGSYEPGASLAVDPPPVPLEYKQKRRLSELQPTPVKKEEASGSTSQAKRRAKKPLFSLFTAKTKNE
jgi:DNA cross-link repair 1B protein